jgi:CheY-like chemotaxis protein
VVAREAGSQPEPEAGAPAEATAEVSFAGVVHEPMAPTGFLPALVLAVDRDPQVTEMYRRYLAAYDVTVISLSELDQIATVARSIQPVAITLDVAMQGRVGGGPPGRDPTPINPNDPFFIDGWQVLKNLKRDMETRNIPVIVCTMANDPQRAYDLGAEGYLLKPILEDDLVQALQKLRKS